MTTTAHMPSRATRDKVEKQRKAATRKEARRAYADVPFEVHHTKRVGKKLQNTTTLAKVSGDSCELLHKPGKTWVPWEEGMRLLGDVEMQNRDARRQIWACYYGVGKAKSMQEAAYQLAREINEAQLMHTIESFY